MPSTTRRRLPLALRLYVIIPIWLVAAFLGLALLGTYTPDWQARYHPAAADTATTAPVCGERTVAGNRALIAHAADGGGFYIDPDACLDASGFDYL